LLGAAANGAIKKTGTKKEDKSVTENWQPDRDTTPVKEAPAAMNETQKVRRVQALTDHGAGTNTSTSAVLSVTPTIDDLNRVGFLTNPMLFSFNIDSLLVS